MDNTTLIILEMVVIALINIPAIFFCVFIPERKMKFKEWQAAGVILIVCAIILSIFITFFELVWFYRLIGGLL